MNAAPELNLKEVIDEYNQFRSQTGTRNVSLQDWAQQLDQTEGSPKRKAAYTQPRLAQQSTMAKQLNDFLDFTGKLAAATPNPFDTVAGLPTTSQAQAQEQFSKLLSGQEVAGEAPYAASTFPGAMSGMAAQLGTSPSVQQAVEGAAASTPRMMARVLNLPAGIADAALESGERAAESGASPGQQVAAGVVGGGTFGLFPAASKLGQQAVAQVVSRTPITNQLMQRALEVGGQNAAQVALGTAGQVAEQAVQGTPLSQAAAEAVSPEAIAGQIVGQLPWLPHNIHEVVKPATARFSIGGNTVDVPLPTATEQARFQRAADLQKSQDAASPLGKSLDQFLAERAMDLGKPVEERKSEGAKEFIQQLSPEQYEQLSPLFYRMPAPKDTLGQQAYDEFKFALSGGDVGAQDYASNHPESKAAWSRYRAAFAKDQADPQLPDLVRAITDTESRLRTEYRQGGSSAEGAKFSLTSPTGDIDFSGARPVQGDEALNAILENRLVPTGVAGNDKAIQLAETLKNGLMPQGARNYSREKDLLRTGVMVREFGPDQLDDKTAITWQRMNSKEKELSLLMADVVKDPKAALGLNEVQWAVNRPPLGQKVAQVADSVLAEHSEPVQTPEQLGSLFKDVNDFQGQVQKMMDQLNLPEDARLQLAKDGPLVPYSESEIQKIYQEELSGALLYPQGEALSRVIENAKSRVLAAKGLADRALEESAKNDAVTRPQMRDFQADAELKSKMEGLPQWVQDVIGTFYGKNAEYQTNTEGRRASRLDSFRQKVGEALDSLSVEDRARLSQVAPTGFSGTEYSAMMRRQAFSKSRGEAEGTETAESTIEPSAKPKYGDMEEPTAPTEASDEQGAWTGEDTGRLRELSMQLQPLLDTMETVPVKYKTEGGAEVRSNLMKVVTEPGTLKDVEFLSERREAKGAPEAMQTGELLTPADREEAQEQAEKATEEGGEGEQADVYRENARGYNEQVSKGIVEKYFDSRGPTFDPVERLNHIDDTQLLMDYASVFSGKSLNRKYTTVMKSGYGADAKSPQEAVARVLKDFLRAELSDPSVAGQKKTLTDDKKRVLEKYYEKPFEQLSKIHRDWAEFRSKMTSDDPAAGARLAMMKALLTGYELKPGVDLVKVGQELSESLKKPEKDFSFNLRRALETEAYRKGLSRDWVKATVPSMVQMMKPFAAIQHAQFAALANPRKAFTDTVETMRALGLSVPGDASKGSGLGTNPIIASDFGEILDQFGYADVAKYVMTTTIAHEALHTFVSEVVKHPEQNWSFHTKAQVGQYLGFIDRVNKLSPEDRLWMLQSTVDTMLPTARTREVTAEGTSKLRPEWQRYTQAAVRNPEEFAAVLYSHAVAGMAREAVAKPAQAVGSVQERMRWLDDDVREFVRGQYRNLADYGDVMQRVLEDESFRRQMGYTTGVEKTRFDEEAGTTVPAGTSKVLQSTTAGAKPAVLTAKGAAGEPSFPEATAAGLVKSAQQVATGTSHYQVVRALAKMDQTLVRIEAQFSALQERMQGANLADDAAKPGGIPTIQLTDDLIDKGNLSALAGKNKGKQLVELASRFADDMRSGGNEAEYRENFFRRFGTLFSQRLNYAAQAGLDAAREASCSLMWQTHARELNSSALMDFFPDAAAKKTQRELHEFLFEAPKTPAIVEARKAFNKIVGRVQELSGQDAVLGGPYVQNLITEATKGLDPHSAAMVLQSVPKFFKSYERMWDNGYTTQRDNQASIIGSLAMKMNPGKLAWKEALSLGQMAIVSAEHGPNDPQMPLFLQQLSGMVQRKALSEPTFEALLGVAGESAQLLSKLEAKKYLYDDNGQKVVDPTTGQPAIRPFASEQRFGRYMVAWQEPGQQRRSTMGFKTETEATRFAAEQVQKGNTAVKVHDKYSWSDQANLANSLLDDDAALPAVKEAWDRQVQKMSAIPGIGTTLAEMANDFDPMTTLAKTFVSRQLENNLKERMLAPGREYIDYLDNWHSYREATNLSMARLVNRSHLMLQANEIRQKGAPTLADDLLRHWTETTTPESEVARRTRQFIAAKSLAMNVANALLELTSPAQSGLWVLARDVGTKNGAMAFGRAATTLTGYATKGHFDELVQQAQDLRLRNQPLSKEQEIAYWENMMVQRGQHSGNPLVEDLEGEVGNINFVRPRTGELGWVDATKFAATSGFNAVNNTLKFASKLREGATGKVQQLSAMAALEAGYEKGLRGDNLYAYASSMIPVMSLVGGRYIRPFGATAVTEKNAFMRNVFGSAYVMMNYEVGFTAQIIKDFHDAAVGAPGMTKQQRLRAAQAATGAVGTTIAMAGMLGVPLVGPLMAITQQITGFDPEAETRKLLQATDERVGFSEAWNHLLGSDEESGNVLTDLAMSGWVNHATGVDFASRAGVNSLFGFNSDTGFSWSDVLGPTVGSLGDVVKAMTLASQGQPTRAALKVAPTGLKPFIRIGNSLYNYGDVRVLDSNDNLVAKPEGLQLMAYALGMGGSKAAEMNREAQLVHRTEEYEQKSRTFEHEQFARDLLNGNPFTTLQHAYSNQRNTDFNAQSFVQSIVDRAIDMQSPRDALEQGALATSRERAALGQTFSTPSRLAMQRLMARDQMMALLGYPFGLKPSGSKEFMKASLVDQLVAQRGVTRQEAMQIVQRQFGM